MTCPRIVNSTRPEERNEPRRPSSGSLTPALPTRRSRDADDGRCPPLLAAAWAAGRGAALPRGAGPPRPVPAHRPELVRATVDQLRVLGPSTSALLAGRRPWAGAGRRPVVDAAACRAPELDPDLVGRRGAGHAATARSWRAGRAAPPAAADRPTRGPAQPGWSWRRPGDPAGDPFLPYRRLEAHAATGRGAARDGDAPTTRSGRASTRSRRCRGRPATPGDVRGPGPRPAGVPPIPRREARPTAESRPRDDARRLELLTGDACVAPECFL